MGRARQRKRANRARLSCQLTSRLLGVSASESTNARFAKLLGFPLTQPIGFLVFETTLGEKTVYCCLAGGRLDHDGTLWFTEIGRATFEALLQLPTTMQKTVILKELRIGRTPLHRKILETVEAAPPGAYICFFGDMAGELDGVAFKALNVQRRVESVESPVET